MYIKSEFDTNITLYKGIRNTLQYFWLAENIVCNNSRKIINYFINTEYLLN
jgi:hypothetical protein